MRPIKFRVWLNGDYFVHAKMIGWEDALQEFDAIDIFQSPEKMTPLQFSGLVDMNENDIYEGDILACDDELFTVIFDEGEFLIQQGSDYEGLIELSEYSRIIGNVYENPGLLEESK